MIAGQASDQIMRIMSTRDAVGEMVRQRDRRCGLAAHALFGAEGFPIGRRNSMADKNVTGDQ